MVRRDDDERAEVREELGAERAQRDGCHCERAERSEAKRAGSKPKRASRSEQAEAGKPVGMPGKALQTPRGQYGFYGITGVVPQPAGALPDLASVSGAWFERGDVALATRVVAQRARARLASAPLSRKHLERVRRVRDELPRAGVRSDRPRRSPTTHRRDRDDAAAVRAPERSRGGRSLRLRSSLEVCGDETSCAPPAMAEKPRPCSRAPWLGVSVLLVGHVWLGPAVEGRPGREAIGQTDAIHACAMMDVVLKDVNERVTDLGRRLELAAMMPICPDLASAAEEAIQPAGERDREPRDAATEHVAILRLEPTFRALGGEPRMLGDLLCRGALRLDGEMKVVLLDREVNDAPRREMTDHTIDSARKLLAWLVLGPRAHEQDFAGDGGCLEGAEINSSCSARRSALHRTYDFQPSVRAH